MGVPRDYQTECFKGMTKSRKSRFKTLPEADIFVKLLVSGAATSTLLH